MIKRLLLFVALSLLCQNLVLAQGYQVNFQGQKQQGMGSAGTALALDAASLFYNPGASSFVEKSSVNLGFTPVFANTLFKEVGTEASARTVSPMGTPFSAYALYKMKNESKWTFGLAVYTPFGSTVEWEDAWVGRFALTRLSLRSVFIQPTASYKINDRVGIGVGFVYCSGSVNLQKDIPVQFSNGEYAHAELSGKAAGIGANAAVYYKHDDKWSFGLSFKSQINMAVNNGTADFTVPESLEENFPDGSFSSSLPLPQVITLGVGHLWNEKLSLAFDMNYVKWSAYDTLAFDYVMNTSSLEDTRSARLYKNTYTFRIGAQYVLSKLLSARLGVAYAMSPVEDGYVTPETPDNDRINFTGGLGLKFSEKFEIDASVLFTKLKRTDQNLETNLNGTFTTIVLAPGMSLIYNF